MTTPTELRRLTARVQNSANILEARIPHATESLARRSADGHPATASGANVLGGGGSAELTATETAADVNLGDLWGYDGGYRPGPTTRLADIAEELRAALKSLDRAHRQLTDCGIAPLLTQKFRCHGVNGTGCEDWADSNRSDHLCIDCGRAVDTNRRRLRRHRAS